MEKFISYFIIIISNDDQLLSRTGHSLHLEIAILSARENFEKRHAIRQTWLQNVKFLNEHFKSNQISIQIDAHFILGSRSCHIHPLNRKTLYGCTELSECNSLSNKSWLFEITYRSKNRYRLFKGFSIKIYRQILVNLIVIRQSLIHRLNIVNVRILNALTKEKLFEFEIKQNENLEDQDFHNENVNFQLDAGSILIFMIDHNNVSDATFGPLSTDNDCAMEILRVSNQNYPLIYNSTFSFHTQSYDGHMNDYESESFNRNQHRFALNFEWQFVLNSESNNNNNNNNSYVWHQKMADLDFRLSNESKTFDDILFVDLIDVYRNLSEKLLKFFHHLFNDNPLNITHVLKTDDDCYLNVAEIVRLIMKNSDSKCTWFGK